MGSFKHTAAAIALLLLLHFPISIFAQINSDFAQIKKEGIREIRFWGFAYDTLPCEILYYDAEGRLRKTIYVGPHLNYAPRPVAYIDVYDTLGRKTKHIEGVCDQMNPAKAKLVPGVGFASNITYAYLGDSVMLQTDSTWLEQQLTSVQRSRQIIHWQKTPPPSLRPIFWQDSIESSYLEITSDYRFYYSNKKEIVATKIDSAFSRQQTVYALVNNKLVCNSISEKRQGDSVTAEHWQKTYTLNEKYDTVTWISYSRKPSLSSKDAQFPYENYHYYTMLTTETNRVGNMHVIHYKNQADGEMTKETAANIWETTIQNPWADHDFMWYETDDFLEQEDMTVEHAKSRIIVHHIEKIKQ